MCGPAMSCEDPRTAPSVPCIGMSWKAVAVTTVGSRAGRAAVLVTGMSGTGKTAVLDELCRRGHRVVDTDDPGWVIEARTPDGPEPVWDVERIAALLDEHGTGSEPMLTTRSRPRNRSSSSRPNWSSSPPRSVERSRYGVSVVSRDLMVQ